MEERDEEGKRRTTAFGRLSPYLEEPLRGKLAEALGDDSLKGSSMLMQMHLGPKSALNALFSWRKTEDAMSLQPGELSRIANALPEKWKVSPEEWLMSRV